MTDNTITLEDVKHVAKLANLNLTKAKLKQFQGDLKSILKFIMIIQTVDTSSVLETTQVSGLTNVWREDVIEPGRTLTQTEALSNAKKTYKGYFVVPAIIE